MLDSQQWRLDDSHIFSGTRMTVHLTSHLIGVGLKDFEIELSKARDIVQASRVGDKITDPYQQEFERIQ